MAIVMRGKSTCPLCGKVLGKDDAIVGTTHFIADQNDPLWRFSDAAMHRACFDAWEHRAEFEAKYRRFLDGCRRSLPPEPGR
jgi:hypothetical protein